MTRRRSAGVPVVLVGDDDAFTKHLAGLIERAGHACRVASTASEALYLARSSTAVVMVLDLSSSKMQSVEVALALRGDLRAPPVVAISSMPNLSQHCASLGITHGLGQPFVLGDLLALLRELAPQDSAMVPFTAANGSALFAQR